jgi:hypothetical protein
MSLAINGVDFAQIREFGTRIFANMSPAMNGEDFREFGTRIFANILRRFANFTQQNLANIRLDFSQTLAREYLHSSRLQMNKKQFTTP